MKKSISLKNLAKNVLETNQYMTLGTVNDKGEPWVSPVVYAFDSECNLYFMSLPSSKHSQNISRTGQVSLAIFDSRQMFGEGVGLQVFGKASVVPTKSAASVFKCYFGRKYPYGGFSSAGSSIANFKKFFKAYKYRFYKVAPTEVWMNDPRTEYDRRVKVSLV